MRIENQQSRIYIVMGVSGSGKTTIGKMLAEGLQIQFYDGDDFHPEANVEKMRAGIPLEDSDRLSWLQQLHDLAKDLLKANGGVIACSALKESYRQILSEGIEPRVKWILLDGEYDVIESRIRGRQGHYMPVELLQSQFDALEVPPYAIRVSITHTPELIVQQVMQKLSGQIGIVGLGVMGRNLAFNFAENGYSLALYNRHVDGKEEHIARDLIANNAELSQAQGFDDLAAFVASLETPRRIVLMIEAGKVVDTVIAQLMPLLEKGDIVADCGNSHYQDTERRQHLFAEAGMHFLGVGVSGGEIGARYGAAIMPGGDANAYAQMQNAFESIAATDKDNKPCCAYIGEHGAGHFVKIVHNGIEYAEMQLIAETYGLLRHGYGYNPEQIAELFTHWHADAHRGFLMDITIQILNKQEGDKWIIDQISDVTKSKGTGGWTLQAANELGVASPLIAAAVHARFLFGNAEDRTRATNLYQPTTLYTSTVDEDKLRDALSAARIINHHLGFELLRAASKAYQWNLDLREISRIWTNGCIIRSTLMEDLYDVLPERILLHSKMETQVQSMRSALSETVISGVTAGLHLPCHGAALNFLNGFTTNWPTGNVIQAQRDFFGAHGFQRVDDPSGKMHHF